jgi:hypothetical protein
VVVEGNSTTAPNSTLPTFDTAATGVELLPSPPLAPRQGPAIVWTGSGLAVWGGNFDGPNSGGGAYRSFNDGAVYDPATRAWTPMAASPLPVGEQAAGVRTDDGIVFTQGRATAIWDPAENSWRKVDDAPAPAFDLTFTGSVVVSYRANATLDPRNGTWQSLPAMPVEFERSTFAWTGHELVVIGGGGTPFTDAEAFALDPERREWRRIANPPTGTHSEALSATWDGRRVVVVNYDMRAIAYDPERDTWTTLPSVPARFSEWSPTTVSVGGNTAVFMAYTVVVLMPNGTWVPLPYGPIPFGSVGTTRPDPTSAAGVVFVAGTRRDGSNAIAILDPARMVETGHRLQVGVGSVPVPAGYRLGSSSYDEVQGGLVSEAVTVNLDGTGGGSCSLQATYSGIVPPSFDALVPETLQTDGAATEWYRNASGTQWRTASTTSDSFDVECADPAVARAIAESASFKIPWS